MIGGIIASDHAEARAPRLLKAERRLAGGFGQPFPFDDRPSREDCIRDLALQFGFGDLTRQGCSGQPAPASAWPLDRAEGGAAHPPASHGFLSEHIE